MARWALAVVVFLVVAGLGAVAVRSMILQRRRMHPEREVVPLDVARAKLPGVEAVAFVTRDGLRLDGWYAAGTNGTAVVFAGGVGARRDELLPEAALLNGAGFGVLLFDWRAEGTSEGTVATWGDLERDDLRAAVDFAARRPDVTQKRVGVFGLSMGGAVAALVAPEEPRIAAMAIAGTYPSLEETTRKDFERQGALSGSPAVWTLRWEGVHVDEVRPIDRLCAFAPRPLLILEGELDDTRVERQGERLFAAACEPKQFHAVPRARHGHLLDAGDPEYPALLRAHFGRMVGAPPTSP